MKISKLSVELLESFVIESGFLNNVFVPQN